jgi:hypothetical protein
MADDPTRPLTVAELRGLSKQHLSAANMAERMGPNAAYTRTMRACAIALEVTAAWMENDGVENIALDGSYVDHSDGLGRDGRAECVFE